MRGLQVALWAIVCFTWRLTTFPELIIRPLVMSLWVRKTFLNEHPVLLLAAHVRRPNRNAAGNAATTASPSREVASESADAEPPSMAPTGSDGTESTPGPVERMSLIEAKQTLREPALVALLFEERIVAVEEEITAPDKETSDRTPFELAVIAELNHEAARIAGSNELAQSTGITLGRRLLSAGRPRRAVAAFLRSARLAESRSDAGGMAVGLWLAGESYRDNGQIDRAMRCFSEAAEIGHRAGVRVEPMARTSLAQILIQRGAFSEAAIELDAAMEVCRRGVRDWLSNALGAQAYLHMLQGQGDDALAAIQEAVSIEKDRESLISLLKQQVGIHQYLGLTEDLPEISDRILSLSAEKSEDDEAPSESTGHGYLADVLGRVREFRHKLDYERRVAQERREAGDVSGHADALIILGTTFGRLCDADHVNEYFDEAARLYGKIGRRVVENTVFSQWAAALANCGHIVRAIELQQRALDAAERMQFRLAHCELLAGMADLLIRNEQFDEAGQCCRQALAECDMTRWPGGRIQPMLRLAEVLRRRGADTADVLDLLNDAVELSSDVDSIDTQVQAKIELVRVLLESEGDLETAQRHLESAEQQARTIGDPDVLRVVLMMRGQCEEALRSDGWEERSRQLYVEAIECYCRQRLAAPAIRDEPFETPYRVSLQAASQELFDRAMGAADRLGDTSLLFWIAELKHSQVLAELICGDYLFLMPPLDAIEQERMPEPAPGEALLVYSLLRDPIDHSLSDERPDADDCRAGASGGQVRGILALLKLPGPDGPLHRIRIPWNGAAPIDDDWQTHMRRLTAAIGNIKHRYEAAAPEQPSADHAASVEQLVSQLTLDAVDDERGTFNDCLKRYCRLLFPESLRELCRDHGVQRLVVVPEGPLYHIPFPALCQSDDQYLIDEFEVTTVPSVALWQECRKREPENAELTLLGVAEPPGSDLAGNGDAEFIRDRIASSVARSPRILSGEGASREQFLEAASAARIIHLMLHGSAESTAILMADEKMTDEALFQLVHSGHTFPACQLMTMNVCFSSRTGQRGHRGESTGDVSLTDSGEISGFPAAILALGVPTLIGSQWELYTVPGRLFFEEFYRRFAREGETAASAYRSAMRAVRDHRGPDGFDWYANPYWWASVALMGDGERRHAD